MIKNNQYRLHLLPLRFAIILMPIFYACGGEAEKPKPPKEAADHPGAAPVAKTYSGNPKHIILISMDTTRPDHFGCYGNPWIKTPNMDALAAQGVQFNQCMTVVPGTLASHTSLFTGKYPHTHGTPFNGFHVNDKNLMLPEILKQYGFQTAGFIAAYPLHSRTNFKQGFDHWDENFPLVKDGGSGQRNAKEMTDTVLNYLDQSPRPDHLFLFVHYFDPHAPYAPPPPYDTMYLGSNGELDDSVRARYPCPVRDGTKIPDDLLMNAVKYAGEVSFMDEHLGRLFQGLRERQILDDALLVITSDHGEQFWEHEPYFDHGETTYESAIHVVAMARLPRGESGGCKVDGVLANIDILPTILGYAHIPVPDDVEGEEINLTPPPARLTDRVRFSEGNQPASFEDAARGWYNKENARCIRNGDFKFIITPYLKSEEYYSLKDDPCEAHDLLTEKDRTKSGPDADQMKSDLIEWSASANPLESGFDKEHREETIKELQAIGYLKNGKAKVAK